MHHSGIWLSFLHLQRALIQMTQMGRFQVVTNFYLKNFSWWAEGCPLSPLPVSLLVAHLSYYFLTSPSKESSLCPSLYSLDPVPFFVDCLMGRGGGRKFSLLAGCLYWYWQNPRSFLMFLLHHSVEYPKVKGANHY